MKLLLSFFLVACVISLTHAHSSSSSLFDSRLGLQNFWKFSNDLTDSITGQVVTSSGATNNYVSDRFCAPNSAIYLAKGYLTAPPAAYFTGDFTVSFWMNLQSYQTSSYLFIFGYNTVNSLGISMVTTTRQLNVFTSSTSSFQTPSLINLKTWYQITFVLRDTLATVYLNGLQVATSTVSKPASVTRALNYIGGPSIFAPDVIIDDFKIYSSPFTWSQVAQAYELSKKSPHKQSIARLNPEPECRRVKPTNFWPLNNNNNDIVGSGTAASCTQITSGTGCTYASDRFNNPNSAMYSHNDYYTLPPGVYFQKEWSVSAWINLKLAYAVLLSFSSSDYSNTTYLGVDGKNGLQLIEKFDIVTSGGASLSSSVVAPTSTAINLNTWYHVVYVSDDDYLKMYLNGVLVSKSFGNYPYRTPTGHNYIGAYINPKVSPAPTSNAYFDDIKIFDVALRSCQVMNEYLISANQELQCPPLA